MKEKVKEERCGTCQSGNVKMIGKPPVDSGFVICALGKPYHWWPQRATCQFTPTRHEQRAYQRERTAQGESDGARHRGAGSALWGDDDAG